MLAYLLFLGSIWRTTFRDYDVSAMGSILLQNFIYLLFFGLQVLIHIPSQEEYPRFLRMSKNLASVLVSVHLDDNCLRPIVYRVVDRHL